MPITEMRVIKMPSYPNMVDKLNNVGGFYGIDPGIDTFFYDFLSSIEDSKKISPRGLVILWELAKRDALGSYPIHVRKVISDHFENVIDIITPDLEIAKQAKALMSKVRNGQKKRK